MDSLSPVVESEPFFHVEGGDLAYNPHQGQLPFHQDAGVIRFRGLFGGTGSGKSLAGIVEDCRWCLVCPGIVGYIFEPTYKMIDRIVIPTLNLLLGTPFWENEAIKSFNRGRMNIEWYNGSVLWLVSLDEPEQAEGGNIDFGHADEARLVKPDRKWDTAWKVIIRRIRGSGLGHPTGAWVTTTPNAPGSVLWNFFENPKKKHPHAKPYRLHIDDNKDNLRSEWIEDQKREHTGALYERFVKGMFAGEDVLTFPFDFVKHVEAFKTEFTRMKYDYPPLHLSEREKRGAKRMHFGDIAYGVDFGWTDETCILAVMFDNDRRAFVLDEVYERHLSDGDTADKCFEMRDRWGEGVFWCDPRSPDTIDFLKREGLKVRGGSGHGGSKAEGIREIGGRFKDAGDGRHRLYVLDSCINLIDELQTYNEERRGHDHAVDALRYCLLGGKRKREASWGFGSQDARRSWR